MVPQGFNVSLKEAISEKISTQPHPIVCSFILLVPIYMLGSGALSTPRLSSLLNNTDPGLKLNQSNLKSSALKPLDLHIFYPRAVVIAEHIQTDLQPPINKSHFSLKNSTRVIRMQ